MSVRLEWTRTAERHLEEIYSYLSEAAGEEIAHLVEKDIFKKAEDLLQFPKSGRVVPEVSRLEIREVFVRTYRVIYRIDPVESPERIYILGVVHPSRLFQNTGVFEVLN